MFHCEQVDHDIRQKNSEGLLISNTMNLRIDNGRNEAIACSRTCNQDTTLRRPGLLVTQEKHLQSFPMQIEHHQPLKLIQWEASSLGSHSTPPKVYFLSTFKYRSYVTQSNLRVSVLLSCNFWERAFSPEAVIRSFHLDLGTASCHQQSLLLLMPPCTGTGTATVAEETQDPGQLSCVVLPNLPSFLVRAVNTLPISCQSGDPGNQLNPFSPRATSPLSLGLYSEVDIDNVVLQQCFRFLPCFFPQQEHHYILSPISSLGR